MFYLQYVYKLKLWFEILRERDYYSEDLRTGWEDNIKINLKRNRDGRCGLDSSGSEYGLVAALLKMVINLGVPYKAGNLLTI
jgi:hypothetical protein